MNVSRKKLVYVITGVVVLGALILVIVIVVILNKSKESKKKDIKSQQQNKNEGTDDFGQEQDELKKRRTPKKGGRGGSSTTQKDSEIFEKSFPSDNDKVTCSIEEEKKKSANKTSESRNSSDSRFKKADIRQESEHKDDDLVSDPLIQKGSTEQESASSPPDDEKEHLAKGLSAPQKGIGSDEPDHEDSSLTNRDVDDPSQGNVKKQISLLNESLNGKESNKSQVTKTISKSKTPAKKHPTVITNQAKTKSSSNTTHEVSFESFAKVGKNIFKQKDEDGTLTAPPINITLPTNSKTHAPTPTEGISSSKEVEIPEKPKTTHPVEYTEIELKLACEVGTKMAKECKCESEEFLRALAAIPLDCFQKFCQDLSASQPDFYQHYFSKLAIRMESFKIENMYDSDMSIPLERIFPIIMKESGIPNLTLLIIFAYLRMQPINIQDFYHRHLCCNHDSSYNPGGISLMTSYLTLTFFPTVFNENKELDKAIDAILGQSKNPNMSFFALALPKESPYRKKILSHLEITDLPDDAIIEQMPLPFKEIFEDLKEVSSTTKKESGSVASAYFFHSYSKLDYSNPTNLKITSKKHYYYKVVHTSTSEHEISAIMLERKEEEEVSYKIDNTSLWSQSELLDDELETLKAFYNANNPSTQLQAFAYAIITYKYVLYFKV